MDIFGLGIGELLLILVIALVVVGPDRLPVLARQAGKMLVTVRNWVQKSPDAAMLLRARQELEAELANIRTSLAEVQTARDEVVQAAKQVNTLVNDDVVGAMRQTVDETTLGSVARKTKPNGLPATAHPDVAAEAAATNANAVEALAEAGDPQIVAPDGRVLIDQVAAEPPEADETARILPPAAQQTADVSNLQAQISALTEELRHLQATLQERGVLDPAPLVAGALNQTFPPLRVPGALQQATNDSQDPVRLLTPDPRPRNPTALSSQEPADVEQPTYSRD